MENQLAKYINEPNLVKAIQSINVVQGTAKETGNIYYSVELSFINGYKKRLFLKSDEMFAWCNAFDQLQTQRVVDATF